MKAKPTANIDRIGVSAVQFMFETIGYSFREQPISDYGIDAHVEIIENEQATGRLIALQIKSGGSWFEEANQNGFVYRGDDAHLNYWLNHSLPVIIVLYNPDNTTAYWQVVTRDTVTSTGKGWKVDVPFDQKVNNDAKPSFQQIAGVRISTSEFTILSLRDVSHNGAKRYTANILIKSNLPLSEVIETLKLTTNNIKQSQYYRNEITKRRWASSKAHVVSLFIYQSMEDVRNTNWICRSQWVDKSLPQQFQPLKIEGEAIGDDIKVEWSKGYKAFQQFYKERTLSKEEYLDKIQAVLANLRPLVASAITFTDTLEVKQIDSERYIEEMRRLEALVTPIYLEATDMGFAPYECKDLNSRFKSMISFAYNILLPFSERGLKTWNEQNRKAIVRSAIEDYRKDMIRLEFEMEKIR